MHLKTWLICHQCRPLLTKDRVGLRNDRRMLPHVTESRKRIPLQGVMNGAHPTVKQAQDIFTPRWVSKTNRGNIKGRVSTVALPLLSVQNLFSLGPDAVHRHIAVITGPVISYTRLLLVMTATANYIVRYFFLSHWFFLHLMVNWHLKKTSV